MLNPTAGYAEKMLAPHAKLRIGVDARCLQPPWAGIARYCVELCRELPGVLPEAEFFLYSHRDIEMPLSSPRWHLRLDPWKGAARLKNIVWSKLRLGRLARTDRLNLFWSPDPFLPYLQDKVPMVSVIHDLNYMLFPQTVHRAHLWACRMFLRSDLQRASAVIANSFATQERLRRRTGVKCDLVVPAAVGKQFRAPSDNAVAAVRSYFQLDRPYLLSVATQEPRKNLATILDAFLRLRSEPEYRDTEMVLVGAAGWRDDALKRRIQSLQGLGVRALGYVPEANLPALYAGCECFVFASLYEGFGFPVLEARACGAPIVATDIPELRESGGGDAVYVKPTLEGILEGIRLARQAKVMPGSLPSWQTSASLLAHLFRRLAATSAY